MNKPLPKNLEFSSCGSLGTAVVPNVDNFCTLSLITAHFLRIPQSNQTDTSHTYKSKLMEVITNE
jgi:hypothetical protein